LTDLEWVADREHEIADLKLVRISDWNNRQERCVHPDHGHIGAGIRTDPPGLQLATIGENHGDLVSTINDMSVGEDDALAGVDHDTGAGRPHLTVGRTIDPPVGPLVRLALA